MEWGAGNAVRKASAYPSALRELNVAAHRAFDSKDCRSGTINRVNSPSFMGPFRGVSAKHLAEYLSWFAWDRVFAAGSREACEHLAGRSSRASTTAGTPSGGASQPQPDIQCGNSIRIGGP